jgi:hypothetical protein
MQKELVQSLIKPKKHNLSSKANLTLKLIRAAYRTGHRGITHKPHITTVKERV